MNVSKSPGNLSSPLVQCSRREFVLEANDDPVMPGSHQHDDSRIRPHPLECALSQTQLSPLSNFMGDLISSKKVSVIEDNAKSKSPKRNFARNKHQTQKGDERWAATSGSTTTSAACGPPKELPLFQPPGNPPLSLESSSMESPAAPLPCKITSSNAADKHQTDHPPQRVRKAASAPRIPKRKQSTDVM